MILIRFDTVKNNKLSSLRAPPPKVAGRSNLFLIVCKKNNNFYSFRVDVFDLLWYIFSMRCKICQIEFIPDKYHPNQQCCPLPKCQRERQVQNEHTWRLRNPNYFKCLGQEGAWRESRYRYNKLWRLTHKDYLKNYEDAHRQQRKEYMREYMRQYRIAKVGEQMAWFSAKIC